MLWAPIRINIGAHMYLTRDPLTPIHQVNNINDRTSYRQQKKAQREREVERMRLLNAKYKMTEHREEPENINSDTSQKSGQIRVPAPRVYNSTETVSTPLFQRGDQVLIIADTSARG